MATGINQKPDFFAVVDEMLERRIDQMTDEELARFKQEKAKILSDVESRRTAREKA